MKTGRKNNSCVTEEWEVFYLRQQTLHFPFQNRRNFAKESRRLRTKCDWPQKDIFHVLWAKLNVENFRRLTALIKGSMNNSIPQSQVI